MDAGTRITENARFMRSLVASYKEVKDLDREYLSKLEARLAVAEIELTRYMRMLRRHNNHHCVN